MLLPEKGSSGRRVLCRVEVSLGRSCDQNVAATVDSYRIAEIGSIFWSVVTPVPHKFSGRRCVLGRIKVRVATTPRLSGDDHVAIVVHGYRSCAVGTIAR